MGSPDPLITYRRVPEHAGIRRSEVERFAQAVCDRVAHHRRFHCLITGDADLRRLNREFLGHDYATDVLSFPASDGTLGDLAISRHRAAVQAGSLGHSITEELEILMLHGVLHLTGFDHERDSGEMAKVEKRWRTRFGLPSGLIERTHRTSARSAAR